MWELDHKEGWALKIWCFSSVVLEKSFESPLDSKKIKGINPKGNQPWIFTGRTDAEAEALILWPPDAKNWLIGRDPDAGIDWGQQKGMTEDNMLDSIADSVDMSLGKLRETVKDREAWHAADHVATEILTQLRNWTEWQKHGYRAWEELTHNIVMMAVVVMSTLNNTPSYNNHTAKLICYVINIFFLV